MPLGPANVHRCALAVSIPAYASVILCIIAEFCSIHPDWMVWRPNIATVVNNKRTILNSTTETPASLRVGVWAYRRVGVLACRRTGVSAYGRIPEASRIQRVIIRAIT